MFYLKKHFFLIIFLLLFSVTNIAYCIPSGDEYPWTYTRDGDVWYDIWGFKRTEYWGDDGYLPNIAYESLGSDRELAYSLGLWFRSNYARRVERAEAILDYVQRWTDYGYDEDYVVMDNDPQLEWAWNADEMAHMFNESLNLVAVGDCEDMSFLCTTMYLAAGFDVAIVSPPAHVALLIWLPEYENANYYWDIPDDDRDYGWIWVEATGEANPLGWTPPDFDDGDWISYIISTSGITVEYNPKSPQAGDEVEVQVSIGSSFGSIEEVLLKYSIDRIETTLEMKENNSLYEATIPSQPENTIVKCQVFVYGLDSNLEKFDFKYEVGGSFDFSFLSIELLIVIGVIILFVLFLVRK
jgi:hypothetical protein